MKIVGGHASHLNAQEIAELRLVGLPTTKTGVRVRANIEGWAFEPRIVRGGEARFYDVMGLPEAARTDLIGRRADAIDAEARPVGRPKGIDWFSKRPDIADAILVIIADNKRSSRTVMRLLAGKFDELPSIRTLQYFIRRVEEEQRVLLTAVRDPDRFKSRYRPALGRMDATVSYAHEMWEIDTTKADVMCTDGRKAILGIIDRWSRRARFLVVESESAQSVRRMLVSTILAWGVMPATLKVDNGSGFMNASIITALDVLGIALDPCLPGHPEDKPHIERVFGTFNRERASLLKGFLGHNVAQAQQLRARARKERGCPAIEAAIDGAELQRILDAWVDGEYHQRKHGSIGMSPMAKWQRSPQPARAAPSPSVLKIALSAYVGTATVGKRGIRWKSGRYWAPTLVALMDKQVTLRRDEDDLGALFVFDDAGNYIDTAVHAGRSGMSDQQFALAARRQMNSWIGEQKAGLRKMQGAFSIDAAREKLLRDEAEAAGKLAHLPMPSQAMATRAMDSIANAPPQRVTDQTRLDEALALTAPLRTIIKSPAEKMAEADAVIFAAERGEDVVPEALRRARLYATTSEYRAEKMLSAPFGSASTVLPLRHRGAA